MSNQTSIFLKVPLKQKGFALFAALIFMAGLTVLAVTVLRSSTLGERIAGNDIDRVRAYQAAEATLRDAQLDLQHVDLNGAVCVDVAPCRSMNSYPNKDEGVTNLSVGCDSGMCFIPLAAMQAAGAAGPWDSTNPLNVNFAQYGQFTGANWIQLSLSIGVGVQLANRPRYWIEIIPPIGASETYRYRITVTAWGVNTNTVVTLQETFQPAP